MESLKLPVCIAGWKDVVEDLEGAEDKSRQEKNKVKGDIEKQINTRKVK
jgi:hypothetical protein